MITTLDIEAKDTVCIRRMKTGKAFIEISDAHGSCVDVPLTHDQLLVLGDCAARILHNLDTGKEGDL